jgi:hypothetical protein
MENETKKLIRVYKKVTVQEVYVWETKKQSYEKIGEDEKGEAKYGYVDVPNKTEKEETSETLYEQKFDENDLNVKELTLWANRVK